jgi:hypothetical protein
LGEAAVGYADSDLEELYEESQHKRMIQKRLDQIEKSLALSPRLQVTGDPQLNDAIAKAVRASIEEYLGACKAGNDQVSKALVRSGTALIKEIGSTLLNAEAQVSKAVDQLTADRQLVVHLDTAPVAQAMSRSLQKVADQQRPVIKVESSAPTVHVAPPVITLNTPRIDYTESTHERDHDGEIVKTTTRYYYRD